MRAIEIQRQSIRDLAAGFLGTNTIYSRGFASQSEGVHYLGDVIRGPQYKVLSDQDLDHTSSTFGQFTTPVPF